MSNLICQYCGKICKNSNSHRNHERMCPSNPGRKIRNMGGINNPMYGKTAWNKGLSKETDSRIAKYSLTRSVRYKSGLSKKSTGLAKTIEGEKIRRDKLSRATENNEFWKYKKKNVSYYHGCRMESSYEVMVAKDLDANNIKWEKPKSFKYTYDNKVHRYTADFYLPEYDVYLDPKNDYLINNVNPATGYCDIDKIKAVEEQNNIVIIVLDKNMLNWQSIKKKIRERHA